MFAESLHEPFSKMVDWEACLSREPTPSGPRPSASAEAALEGGLAQAELAAVALQRLTQSVPQASGASRVARPELPGLRSPRLRPDPVAERPQMSTQYRGGFLLGRCWDVYATAHSLARSPYFTKSSYWPHLRTCSRKHPSYCIPIFCMTRPEAGLHLKCSE